MAREGEEIGRGASSIDGRGGLGWALGRSLAWIAGSCLALTLAFAVTNLGLTVALFGPRGAPDRLVRDWRWIVLAHQLKQDRISLDAAFAEAHGRDLGAEPAPERIRAYLARSLKPSRPVTFDVVLARYIVNRFGAIDGRTVPPGVYLAAGPIGPDAWPGPLANHFLLFPRHGYLLVVPPRRGDDWPTAYEATASLRRDLRPGGDADALYAVIQAYRPGAYDFPRPGEPLHDLLLISSAPLEIAHVEERLRSFRQQLDGRSLSYRLFRRNSNSALACYLQATGLDPSLGARFGSPLLLRLRLPGIFGGGKLC